MKKQLLLINFLFLNFIIFSQNSGNFSGTTGDNQNYQITAPGNGYYKITLTSNGGTICQFLLQPNNIFLGSITTSSENSTVTGNSSCLSINEVIRFSVYKSDGGSIQNNYTLNYEFISSTYAGDDEPNNLFSEAILMTESNKYEGWLNRSSGDNDWYKFIAPRDGVLKITFIKGEGNGTATLKLFNDNNQIINHSTFEFNGLEETYTFNNFNFNSQEFGIFLEGSCISYKLSFVINSTLGTNRYNLENSIKLYPNPVLNNLKATINNGLDIEKVEIIGITGKQIIKTYFINNSIPTQNLKSGVYFLKLYTNKGIVNKKILKSE